MTRIAAIGEVHANVLALEAVLAAIREARADVLMVAGGLVLDGPEPAATLDLVRELEEEGAMIVSGRSDIAVADFDFATARAPGEPTSPALRSACEWAHEALGPERVDWLRRLPGERRLWLGDTLVLWSHAARPGAAAQGPRRRSSADAAIHALLAGTDADVVACAGTHVADVRTLDDRLYVNVGSVGRPRDGQAAAWALIEVDDDRVSADVYRVAYDHHEVAEALAGRGLPGDAERAAAVGRGQAPR